MSTEQREKMDEMGIQDEDEFREALVARHETFGTWY
jgi:hypothetical protein